MVVVDETVEVPIVVVEEYTVVVPMVLVPVSACLLLRIDVFNRV